MTMTNVELSRLIDRLIRIKDSTSDSSTRDTINDACNALESYRDKALPLGLKLATLLDAATPLLDRQSEIEAAQEAGKPMRQITHQQRAKAAHTTLDDAASVFGFSLPA